MRPFIIALRLSLVFLLCGHASLLYGADLDKEKRMRDQVADYVIDGDVVLLNANGHTFFSIYMTVDTPPAKGTVLILHGRGLHPNWPKVIYPLRSQLPEQGWNTLAIQLPILSNDSSFYDYLDTRHESHPRLDAAMVFLRQQNHHNIILLAHSCGVHMGFDWLHKHPQAGINAFIGIGMGSTDVGQPMPVPFALEEIKIPVLDIYGEDDYPSVKKFAPRRWQHIQQAGHPKSQHVIVDDAEHYFTDQTDALITHVVDWLNTL